MRSLLTIAIVLCAFPLQMLGQSAESCGVCHSSIYSDWAQSAHSKAWNSESFQEQLWTFGSSGFCGQCHAPNSVWERVNLKKKSEGFGLSDQPVEKEQFSGEKALLRQKPEFRTANLEDGVTCGSCHQVEVRTSTATGEEFVGPYHSSQGHGGQKAAEFENYRLCGTCHGRPAAEYQPQGYLAQSTFHHDRVPSFQFAFDSSDCSSCHMPRKTARLVQLNVFKDLPRRQVGSHTFSGIRYQQLKNALALKLESTPEGAVLAITNQGVGHPLQISFKTAYLLQVSLVRNGAVAETTSLLLADSDKLEPGRSMKVPLPFAVKEGDRLQVEFIVQEAEAEGQKAFELVL